MAGDRGDGRFENGLARQEDGRTEMARHGGHGVLFYGLSDEPDLPLPLHPLSPTCTGLPQWCLPL